MAGNYDILSNNERIRRLQSVKDEINQAIAACKQSQLFWTRSMANADYVDWTNILSNVLLKMAAARQHAINADTELGQLALLDSIYPYFTFQYEWVVGKGGITGIEAAGGQSFLFEGVLGGMTVVPNTIISVDSILETGGFTNAANNGVFTISAITSTGIDVDEDASLFAETTESAGAYVRLIQLEVV